MSGIERVVIHDPDAGEVVCFRREGETASASRFGAFVTWAERPDSFVSILPGENVHEACPMCLARAEYARLKGAAA